MTNLEKALEVLSLKLGREPSTEEFSQAVNGIGLIYLVETWEKMNTEKAKNSSNNRTKEESE